MLSLFNLFKELKKMRSSDDPKLRNASIGLLHQLGLINIHDEPPVEKQSVPPTPDQQPPSYDAATAGNLKVMISYNLDHQERAKIIRDSLKAQGLDPWMDLSNMGK